MGVRARAVVLDFDGLIADTEVLWFAVLEQLYRSRSQQLPKDLFVGSIGGTLDSFDPFQHLAGLCGSSTAAELEFEGEQLFRSWMKHEAPLPGIRRMVSEASSLGLAMAVASSSAAESVLPHLRQFGLSEAFAAVVTADDVDHVKPHPELYLRAAELLGVEPESVIAFEDSSRGVRAAKAAGAFCVAVPHVLSRAHDLSAADVLIDSMGLCRLDDILLIRSQRQPRMANATVEA